jgi:protein subunit release factor A
MEQERLDMQEMEQDPSADAELREYSRSEQKVLVATQEELESDLMLMLLPQDPLDEKNVMLEVSRRTLYFPSYP